MLLRYRDRHRIAANAGQCGPAWRWRSRPRGSRPVAWSAGGKCAQVVARAQSVARNGAELTPGARARRLRDALDIPAVVTACRRRCSVLQSLL